MKSKKLLIISALAFVVCFQPAKSGETKNFPFDPFIILKSWNYDILVKTMGNGEEILAKSKNQTYLAGLRYPANLLGMRGKLEFNFTKDSISRFQFRQEHEVRVTNADVTNRKNQDPTVSPEYALAIQRLDSLQKIFSLSRDSVVQAISEILGPPFSYGRTPVAEKNARYSAIWIMRGYSCLYKDYSNYSEIVFSLSKVPLVIVGEFDIPAGTEILQKTLVNTRKMSWNASLLGYPAEVPRMTYSNIFLLLEFVTGQKYLVSLPKNAIDFLSGSCFLEFATRQRCLMTVPKNSIGYLPFLTFEDCDGDGIPEAWIQVPIDIKGSQSRHYIFSLPYKEPNLIFNSDEQIPTAIRIKNGSQIQVTFQDGTIRVAEAPNPVSAPNQITQLTTNGFQYLRSTKLNTDGSTNFVGGIELSRSKEAPGSGILEISYKHTVGGWEPGEINLIQKNK